jgi:hypothetical protein
MKDLAAHGAPSVAAELRSVLEQACIADGLEDDGCTAEAYRTYSRCLGRLEYVADVLMTPQQAELADVCQALAHTYRRRLQVMAQRAAAGRSQLLLWGTACPLWGLCVSRRELQTHHFRTLGALGGPTPRQTPGRCGCAAAEAQGPPPQPAPRRQQLRVRLLA